MQKIVPHLWFDKEAGEAAEFYMSLFADSKIKDTITLSGTPSGTVEILTVELAGQEFMFLSAGPYFKFTPAVSFLIVCNTVAEAEMFWENLVNQGTVLMELGSYPFSERYGWVQDKYGLSWQIMYIGEGPVTQKIISKLMFVGKECGKTEEAIGFYTSLFHNSEIGDIYRYGENETPDKPGTVANVSFKLENQEFAAMDSAHAHEFSFNEAISFVVNCKDQAEIDYYWEKLSADREAEQCGWLKDKYGLSWQIVPEDMNDYMRHKDPDQLKQVTEVMLNMKKLNIHELKRAYETTKPSNSKDKF